MPAALVDSPKLSPGVAARRLVATGDERTARRHPVAGDVTMDW